MRPAATLSGCGRPIRLKTEDVFIKTTVLIKINLMVVEVFK